jgi:hypothetical protein
MLNHGIPHKSQPDRYSVQYLKGRAALVHIFLQSDGNIQLTEAMGANTVYRIKTDCVELDTKEIMVMLAFFRFSHSLVEETRGTYPYRLQIVNKVQIRAALRPDTIYRIKADCPELETKETMEIFPFFSFGHSIFEGRALFAQIF